ncbi:MAG: GTP 3',8-cyclase MoaA [Dethiobacter sp.]|nr:GTP 3',8-cyclase MoaA [Dethiobacter sp.]MBS3902062.1 GTP 3',8-cyclase MoaA [Dethiobacter sp.]MBS3990341.1 GTP 3',8-cyclase MoaA [Dethiobacter sp.]
MASLADKFGRQISYLRISVIDRCNLNCFYCMPVASGCRRIMGDELNLDEIIRIVRAAAVCGISKIRLTGGEPLLRPDLVRIVKNISAIPGITDISLTTNGLLLPKLARPLAVAGLNRVNISLDSLQSEVFRRITRGGELEDAIAGLQAAYEAGLTPVKINAVLLKGINDGEVADFARLTLERDIHVRFIEFMPISGDSHNWKKHYQPIDTAIKLCAQVAPLIEADSPANGGPARYFRLKGGKGKLGFISPLSRHFCSQCNRLRVTAQGKLRACLFSQEEIDLRPLLGQEVEVIRAFSQALTAKPDPTRLDSDPLVRCQPNSFGMVSIGG